MRRSVPAIGLALTCAVAATYALAAYLETGAESVRVPPPPPPREMRPAPEPGEALRVLVRNLDVGRPRSHGQLRVCPLILRGGRGGRRVLTMDEAAARGELAIREKDEGRVPEVLARNDAREPVFLMSGEIIVGGRQNRIVRDDVLLPPRSDFITIEVYCGEQRRWHGPETGFKSGGTLSAPSLRRMAAAAESQDRIWLEIDGQLSRSGVPAPTRNYQRIYEDSSARGELDRCAEALRGVGGGDAVGCLIYTGRGAASCELFSDPGLFARLWPKICRSYAMDLLGPDPRDRRDPRWHEESVPGWRDPRRFLENALATRFAARYTPGMGRLLQASGGPLSGSALEDGGDLIHASLFDGHIGRRPAE